MIYEKTDVKSKFIFKNEVTWITSDLGYLLCSGQIAEGNKVEKGIKTSGGLYN